MQHLLNILFGLIPVLTLGWSQAADLRKESPERVVVTSRDEHRHMAVFLLVSGLWSLTLAMWNWMRGYSIWWIVLWTLVGAFSLSRWWMSSRSR